MEIFNWRQVAQDKRWMDESNLGVVYSSWIVELQEEEEEEEV
jgi:hypothetical protein